MSCRSHPDAASADDPATQPGGEDATVGTEHCLRLLLAVVHDVVHDVTRTPRISISALAETVTDKLASRAGQMARHRAVHGHSPAHDASAPPARNREPPVDRDVGAPGQPRRTRRAHMAVVGKALRFIEGESRRPTLMLRDVARHVGLTPSYLDRLLTRYTGSSFAVHRSLARLEHASRLLLTTELSIKEIAGASGYNSVSTFDRAFVRMFDCTPSEWRHGAAGYNRV